MGDGVSLPSACPFLEVGELSSKFYGVPITGFRPHFCIISLGTWSPSAPSSVDRGGCGTENENGQVKDSAQKGPHSTKGEPACADSETAFQGASTQRSGHGAPRGSSDPKEPRQSPSGPMSSQTLFSYQLPESSPVLSRMWGSRGSTDGSKTWRSRPGRQSDRLTTHPSPSSPHQVSAMPLHMCTKTHDRNNKDVNRDAKLYWAFYILIF